MAFPYIYPTITNLPSGYDCTVVLPLTQLERLLPQPCARVLWAIRVFCEGQQLVDEERELLFRDGSLQGVPPPPFVWKDRGPAGGEHSGFLEMSFRAADQAALFASRMPLRGYAIHSAAGKKSFFSDYAYKFAQPPIISQIAAFGRYVEGYPVVHLYVDRDLGETLALINPYTKPLVARVLLSDGRDTPRFKVPPLSVRNVRLAELLRAGERVWLGQIQLTASNRLVPYHIKHSLADPRLISDHEHLDPFRSDPTYLPATQWLRQRIGKLLVYSGLR